MNEKRILMSLAAVATVGLLVFVGSENPTSLPSQAKLTANTSLHDHSSRLIEDPLMAVSEETPLQSDVPEGEKVNPKSYIAAFLDNVDLFSYDSIIEHYDDYATMLLADYLKHKKTADVSMESQYRLSRILLECRYVKNIQSQNDLEQLLSKAKDLEAWQWGAAYSMSQFGKCRKLMDHIGLDELRSGEEGNQYSQLAWENGHPIAVVGRLNEMLYDDRDLYWDEIASAYEYALNVEDAQYRYAYKSAAIGAVLGYHNHEENKKHASDILNGKRGVLKEDLTDKALKQLDLFYQLPAYYGFKMDSNIDIYSIYADTMTESDKNKMPWELEEIYNRALELEALMDSGDWSFLKEPDAT